LQLFSYICSMKVKKNTGLDFVIDKLTTSIELDVDFIGSQEPLTSSEENALSEFFKKKKELKKQKSLRIQKTTKKLTTSF